MHRHKYNLREQKLDATVRDAVYGAAIGDALGVPYEGEERGAFECTGMVADIRRGQEIGTWSDDTSMMLAICDSIRELDRVDVDDIRKKFQEWYFDDRYTVNGVFSVGFTTSISLLIGGGVTGHDCCGNGSLMRTIPLAFAPCGPEDVRKVSAITHANKLCCDICAEYVKIVWLLLEGIVDKDDLRSAYPFSMLNRDVIRSGGYVKDTFGAALWCFLNTENYADCVLTAVNLGDDTDTTACVAGGLAGAYYGIEKIPREWIDELQCKDLIDSCLF